MAHRVKAALATFRVAGQLIYMYEGGVLPEGVDKDDLKHLVDNELVEEFDESESADEKPARKPAARK